MDAKEYMKLNHPTTLQLMKVKGMIGEKVFFAIMQEFAEASHTEMPSEEDRATLIKFLEWYLDDGITVYDESEEAVDEFFKQSLTKD